MGFDPRRWRPGASGPPVTSNVESLLAENDALRREVRALRSRLEQLQLHSRTEPRADPHAAHGLTPDRVERWGQAMAAHPRGRPCGSVRRPGCGG